MEGKTKRVSRKMAADRLAVASKLASRIYTHGSTLLLVIVLGGEIGLAIFVVRDLLTAYAKVQQVYAGSVPGLRRIGELQYQAQETRRSTLYALTTNDGNLQVDYADQSREADRRVAEGIAEYLMQARTAKEIEVGKRLANDWDAYLRVRNDVLGFILEGSLNEAVHEDLTSGVPIFDRVRRDLDDVKRLYDEQALQQLTVVAVVSRRSVLKIIAALGFTLFFGGIAVWTIQRNRMRAAVQLAKLQMDFVASVSHELRTPITAVLSASENIRDGFVGGKALVEQSSIIVDQADQLANLVDQVLLFAAPVVGKSRYALRPLQVSEILECALQNTAVPLQKSGFTVEQRIQPGLPRVMGDLSAVSRCLQNLITNAVKYGEQVRWVGLSARVDDSMIDKKEVRISVKDYGLGINSSELPRVFEPFYRSPRVVAAQIHGTGLGLSIAKNIIEAMGGRLSVVSEAGVGSTFTLHLPVADDHACPYTAEVSEQSHGAPLLRLAR